MQHGQSHQQICPAENNQSSKLQMITVYSEKDSSDEERWQFSTQTHSDIQQLSVMLILGWTVLLDFMLSITHSAHQTFN